VIHEEEAMKRLGYVVRSNAVFSGVSGLVLLAGAGALEETLGLEGWILALAGAALVQYGALLWLLAQRHSAVAAATFATVMDGGWVVGAAGLLLAFPTVMTPVGRSALLAVSVVVLGFAESQFFELRRARGSDRSVAVPN
jgi:hypothetical protein